jgi:class 3 adenylate cyclase
MIHGDPHRCDTPPVEPDRTMPAAARILDAAQPGEVLVSTTIRDLLSGSGLQFVDRGEFELRDSTGAAAWRR